MASTTRIAPGRCQGVQKIAQESTLVALLCFAETAYARAAHVLCDDAGFIIAGRTPARAVRLCALKGAKSCIFHQRSGVSICALGCSAGAASCCAWCGAGHC